MAGKLIVIEGIDGSGKTTQTEMLVRRLKQEGHPVETIDFPQYYSTFFGKMVARYLRGEFGTVKQVSPYLAALLYAGDRFEQKDTITKWLADGKIVVANRYASANMGHQASKIPRGAARTAFIKWLDELEYQMFGIPRADAVLFLYVPTKIAQKLVDLKGKEMRKYANGKKRDIHEASSSHLLETEKAFLQLCRSQPEWKRIDCVRNGKILFKEQVHARIWDAVQAILRS